MEGPEKIFFPSTFDINGTIYLKDILLEKLKLGQSCTNTKIVFVGAKEHGDCVFLANQFQYDP